MKRIAVCVVNFNNGDKTINCIHSILDQTFQNFNIIIIDNGSDDNSVAATEEYCISKGLSVMKRNEYDYLQPLGDRVPAILLITSTKNGGYAYGVNIGIRFTRLHNEFSHILILNNDLILKPCFLMEMMNEFDRTNKKFDSMKIALGAVELSPAGKVRHHGFHYMNLLSGLVFSVPLFPSLKYVVGSAIFIDSGAPLMDESFFLYYEDVHYGLTLKKNNYHFKNCKKAFYVHELEGSTKNDPDLYKIIFTSLIRFYKLNYPYLLPFVLLVRLIISLLLGRWRIAKYILRG